MAARVLLLFAVTGLFAAAWNSDHPDSATSRLASAPSRAKLPPHAATARGDLMVSKSIQVAGLSSEFEPSAIPLPTTITAGTYRIVDAQGRVGWITIPAEGRSEVAAGEPQPLYLSQSETEHWYFIRVQPAPVIAAPQTSDAIRR